MNTQTRTRRLNRRNFLQATAALGAAPLLANAQQPPAPQAPAWPTRPVRIIVTSAAGSPWDPMARILAERLASSMGQPFFVENKSGASGMIGMDQVAKTTDGHTLGVMFMPHTVLPSLLPRMPYDTLADLQPVAQTQWTYNVLVVRPDLGVNSLDELLKLARQRPGQLSYASGGNGTPAHLMGEYFKQQSGTFILHVPYRGPVGALQDLIGGRNDMMFASAATAMPHVQAGRLRALAVTSAQPLEAFPGVPTFAQAGWTKFDVRDWAGIVAPRSLPAEAVPRLNAAIIKALGDPALVDRFSKMGIYLHTGSPQQFDQLIRAELPKWRTVVQQAGIQMES